MNGLDRQCLLDTLNAVWISKDVPVLCKHADIVSNLKPGTPARLLVKLRPIILISTLCRLHECMVYSSLGGWLQHFGWYNLVHIEFRSNLDTEDGLDHLPFAVFISGRSLHVCTLLAIRGRHFWLNSLTHIQQEIKRRKLIYYHSQGRTHLHVLGRALINPPNLRLSPNSQTQTPDRTHELTQLRTHTPYRTHKLSTLLLQLISSLSH